MTLQIRSVSTEEFAKAWQKHGPKIFDSDHWIVRTVDLYSKHDLARVKENAQLIKDVKRINLLAFQNGKFAGWSWGMQKEAELFYMVNSAVLPEFRRKGIYTALMNTMVKHALKEGFQKIYSRHVATNNAVIIPKLKAGFVITSMEISENFGALVHLAYIPNKARRKILDVRCGMRRPSKDLKKHLGLK